jgi:hypothetical protein
MLTPDVLKKIDAIIAEDHSSPADDPVVEDNTILSCLCLHPEIEPRELGDMVNQLIDKHKYNGNAIIDRLRYMWLSVPAERVKIIQLANAKSKLLYDSFSGDAKALAAFREFEENAYGTYSRDDHAKIMRCVLISLFTKFSPLKKLPHACDVYDRAMTRAKACLLELSDAAQDVCRHQHQSGQQAKKEDASAKAAHMEERLKRSQEMLEELQAEFESRLQESKTQEITNFFSALNSEKYGCILDGLFSSRKGLDALRKRNYELPLEINGLSILVRKLIQFVRDSGINPIRRVGERMKVTSADIENFSYIGAPFENAAEEKLVEVIAPGWVYKARNIQVARPTIKEVIPDNPTDKCTNEESDTVN